MAGPLSDVSAPKFSSLPGACTYIVTTLAHEGSSALIACENLSPLSFQSIKTNAVRLSSRTGATISVRHTGTTTMTPTLPETRGSKRWNSTTVNTRTPPTITHDAII